MSYNPEVVPKPKNTNLNSFIDVEELLQGVKIQIPVGHNQRNARVNKISLTNPFLSEKQFTGYLVSMNHKELNTKNVSGLNYKTLPKEIKSMATPYGVDNKFAELKVFANFNRSNTKKTFTGVIDRVAGNNSLLLQNKLISDAYQEYAAHLKTSKGIGNIPKNEKEWIHQITVLCSVFESKDITMIDKLSKTSENGNRIYIKPSSALAKTNPRQFSWMSAFWKLALILVNKKYWTSKDKLVNTNNVEMTKEQFQGLFNIIDLCQSQEGKLTTLDFDLIVDHNLENLDEAYSVGNMTFNGDVLISYKPKK